MKDFLFIVLITLFLQKAIINNQENYHYFYDFEIKLKINFYQYNKKIVNFKIKNFKIILNQKYTKIIKRNEKKHLFEQKKLIWKKGLLNQKCDVKKNISQLDFNNIFKHKGLYEQIKIRIFVKSKNLNVLGKEYLIKLENLKKRFNKIEIEWKSKNLENNLFEKVLQKKDYQNDDFSNEISIKKHSKESLIKFRELECVVANHEFYDKDRNLFYLDLYLSEKNYNIENYFNLEEKYKDKNIHDFEFIEEI